MIQQNEEKVLAEATLCYPVREGKVLLARKTRKIGAGCWNGFGGGIEPGESARGAAVRELREECGISARQEALEQIACIDFHNTKSDGTQFVCSVYCFKVSEWQGEIAVSDEMENPTWFPLDKLPLDELMPADPFWLPRALAGEKLVGEVYYGAFQKTLLAPVKLTIVTFFPKE